MCVIIVYNVACKTVQYMK